MDEWWVYIEQVRSSTNRGSWVLTDIRWLQRASGGVEEGMRQVIRGYGATVLSHEIAGLKRVLDEIEAKFTAIAESGVVPKARPATRVRNDHTV